MNRSPARIAARCLAAPYLACGALLALFVARGGTLWLPFAPPLGAPVLLPVALLWLGIGGVLMTRGWKMHPPRFGVPVRVRIPLDVAHGRRP